MATEEEIRFVKVCAVKDIPRGKGKGFKVGKVELAVFHTEEGFFATNDICSHERENLNEGWLEAHTVECPRHGSVFDLRTGEAISLPATEPIEVFPVEVEGDDLKVGIPAFYLNSD